MINNKIEDAIKKMQENDIDSAKLICESLLKEKNEDPRIKNILAITLIKKNEIEKALPILKSNKKQFPQYVPSYVNIGIINLKKGKNNEALKYFKKTLDLDPKNLTAYENILIILLNENKTSEVSNILNEIQSKKIIFNNYNYYAAINYEKKNEFKKAFDCYSLFSKDNPDSPQSLEGLARLSQQSNDIKNAITFYKKAISVTPKAESLLNLSTCLDLLGEEDEAKACALNAKEISNEINILLIANNKLATFFFREGRYLEASEICHEAIEKFKTLNNPNQVMIDNLKFIELTLGGIIEEISLKRDTPYTEDKFSQKIARLNFDFLNEKMDDETFNPKTLHYPNQKMIKSAINNHNKINKENLIKIIDLDFLVNFLKRDMVDDIEIEEFLIKVRSLCISLIVNNDEIIKNKLFKNFIGALAIQCNKNEYIWETNDDDIKNKDVLLKKISEIKSPLVIELEEEILALLTLQTFKSYEELSRNKNLKNSQNAYIRKIFELQVSQIEEENKIKKDIKSLEEINNKISIKVQNQYEENPYPRWEIVDKVKTKFYSDSVQNQIKPNNNKISKRNLDSKESILIAGCGTGLHPIKVALNAQESKITALDLSFSSLAYAQRKSNEMNIKNINWIQGDILKAKELKTKFDYIESCGVLHHMEDPIKGFKVLNSLLKPGGFFKIALYSSTYKNLIKGLHDYAAEKKIGTSLDEIRQFRKYIKLLNNEESRHVQTYIKDFYSTSEFRDLLLHSQEHFFSIDQIKKNIIKNEFEFLGFVFSKEIEKNFYKKNYPEDKNLTDLDNWEEIENKNPMIFRSMYQFWLKKKSSL